MRESYEENTEIPKLPSSGDLLVDTRINKVVKITKVGHFKSGVILGLSNETMVYLADLHNPECVYKYIGKKT